MVKRARIRPTRSGVGGGRPRVLEGGGIAGEEAFNHRFSLVLPAIGSAGQVYGHSEAHQIEYHGSYGCIIEISETASPISDGVILQVRIAVEVNVGNHAKVFLEAHTDCFREWDVDEAEVAMGPLQDAFQELWIPRKFIRVRRDCEILLQILFWWLGAFPWGRLRIPGMAR